MLEFIKESKCKWNMHEYMYIYIYIYIYFFGVLTLFFTHEFVDQNIQKHLDHCTPVMFDWELYKPSETLEGKCIQVGILKTQSKLQLTSTDEPTNFMYEVQSLFEERNSGEKKVA